MSDFARKILVLLVIALVFKFLVADIVHTQGESMEPTVQSGDMFIIEKLSYKFRDPGIGDLVMVERNNGEMLLKRVVAVAGDEVWAGSGYLYRNGEIVGEPYVEELMKVGIKKIKIPEGQIYVLGDNRNYSTDSRNFGPIPIENVTGKVWMELTDEFFTFY